VPPTSTPSPFPTYTATPVIPTPTPTPARPIAKSPPTRLVIADIKLDTAVEPVGYKSLTKGGKITYIWDTPSGAAGFHETSAYPGHQGNIVINGHRDIQGAVFFRLTRVEIGDEIELYVEDDLYPYVVSEVLEIPYTGASAEEQATHLRLMSDTPSEQLTLITCTPVILATHRLYIIAEPIDVPRVDRRQES
jgi:sortase A